MNVKTVALIVGVIYSGDNHSISAGGKSYESFESF